jgi:ubiquinone/menaquinone biosynthesis C-methylase UbiE
MNQESYIHGFTKAEQDRLLQQARIHEDTIFSRVDFSKVSRLLEVGCGVGAQTRILTERYPEIHIDSVDGSASQLVRARQTLEAEVARGQVQLHQSWADKLPFAEDCFDGAFVCWLLEHVPDPLAVLKEIRRVLKPDGVVYCNEVFNSTFYLHPYSPATLRYWFEFNDHQWALKGDPFVGGKLGNLLISAGFQNVSTQVLTHQYDNRTPKKRSAFIDYWTELLLSGAPGLLAANRVTPELVAEVRKEAEVVKSTPDSVIFYSWILARAQAF